MSGFLDVAVGVFAAGVVIYVLAVVGFLTFVLVVRGDRS